MAFDDPSEESRDLLHGLDGEDVHQRPQRKRKATGDALDTVPIGYPAAGELSRARPTWEDMIIAYSTIPGYASIRDRDKGE